MGKPNACRFFSFLGVTGIAAGFLATSDDQTLRVLAWVFLGIGSLVSLGEAWKLSGECECVKECMISDEPGTTGTSDDPRVDPWGLQPRFNIENI